MMDTTAVPAPPSSVCDRCGEPIRWTRTKLDRWLAVDANPSTAGNAAVYRDDQWTWRARILTRTVPAPREYEVLYMPHAATCPARAAARGEGA